MWSGWENIFSLYVFIARIEFRRFCQRRCGRMGNIVEGVSRVKCVILIKRSTTHTQTYTHTLTKTPHAQIERNCRPFISVRPSIYQTAHQPHRRRRLNFNGILAFVCIHNGTQTHDTSFPLRARARSRKRPCPHLLLFVALTHYHRISIAPTSFFVYIYLCPCSSARTKPTHSLTQQSLNN